MPLRKPLKACLTSMGPLRRYSKPGGSDRSVAQWLFGEVATKGSSVGRVATTESMVALSQCMCPPTKCRIVSLTLSCIKPSPLPRSPRLPCPSRSILEPSPTRDAWHRIPRRSGSQRRFRHARLERAKQVIVVGIARKVKRGSRPCSGVRRQARRSGKPGPHRSAIRCRSGSIRHPPPSCPDRGPVRRRCRSPICRCTRCRSGSRIQAWMECSGNRGLPRCRSALATDRESRFRRSQAY